MARAVAGPLRRPMGAQRRIEVGSVLIAVYLCLLTVMGFVVASDRFLHWFVLRVTCCGVMIGIDAVDRLRGRVHLFDPVGILGLFGLHFFFLAPLLHVYAKPFLQLLYDLVGLALELLGAVLSEFGDGGLSRVPVSGSILVEERSGAS